VHSIPKVVVSWLKKLFDADWLSNFCSSLDKKTVDSHWLITLLGAHWLKNYFMFLA